MPTQTQIADEISRIQGARDTIRSKLVTMGIGTTTDLIDTIATNINSIYYGGTIDASVQEGDSYTIEAGYYSGGQVQGVGGGGNYTLQAKTVTPTKSQQNITSDGGYYGLSSVTVNAIPNNYQDVSSVTATAGEVLANKLFVTSAGTLTAGTMANNGAISKTLDATTNNQIYTVPAGYHNGSGKVQVVLESKVATPSTSSQSITPTSGKVLSAVTVEPIPAIYGDASSATVTAADLIAGEVAIGYVGGEAVEITGTMTDVGTVTQTLNTTTTSYTIPAGRHSGSGTVSINLETKTATPTTGTQNITPSTGKVLSKVVVNPIPTNYGDATGKTVTASSVLSGVTAIGINNGVATSITGTMANNAAITGTIDGLTTTSYTVPEGFHNGSGTVSLTDDIETALAAI